MRELWDFIVGRVKWLVLYDPDLDYDWTGRERAIIKQPSFAAKPKDKLAPVM